MNTRTAGLRLILALIFVLAGQAGRLRAAPGELPAATIFLPVQAHVAYISSAPRALIFAFVPDGLAANDLDEAVAIQNQGRNPVWLAGWQLSDGEGTVTLPALTLPAGGLIWCARTAVAFRAGWGFAPDCEYEADSDPAIPNANGRAPNLNNAGDEVELLAPDGATIDAIPFAASTAALSLVEGRAGFLLSQAQAGCPMATVVIEGLTGEASAEGDCLATALLGALTAALAGPALKLQDAQSVSAPAPGVRLN